MIIRSYSVALPRRGSAKHRAARVADLDQVRARNAPMVRMSHDLAAGFLEAAGMRYKSSGHCTDRRIFTCTSLDRVRTGTIDRIVDLKRESGCPITVTGGTEAGHAPGRYSHGAGYKLDISHNRCIDQYITDHYRQTRTRGDGSPLYRSDAGTIFADESDHWDILFR
ncbi:hypothetical protein [Nonomuraea roseoviolacea]|uniref:Uncharacterized protein n=1 Tax=Nonomuraea roseoviolacea subsp. carminata TaxID=160689 RepID=A0ABT1K0B4_9ACTN|nr:hypothetical protein [Nonomuraea roseoviolacea]MCP2347444.1 hypothetical protein [Nonomuraea roseoviolacea subsp. carminata]